jgi:catechol 2,3-dioxygenase-like lactoylglutathione lyase family enzyme
MTGRGIDHLVLCVYDLDRARDVYARMGFTLTPKALHPFGTGNSLVQFEGCFLELLSIVEPEKIAEPVPGAFGFAAFNRDFLGAGEGFSMLVFESSDAVADRREFADKGLSRLAPFDFERLARQPDGTDVTVGFSLTFVTHPEMPRAAFFTCQQHAPQYFWKPEYQRHANTARTIAEVVMVAQAPDRCAALFAGLHGADAVAAGPDGIVVTTARGRIAVLTPQAWAARYGALPHPDLGEGPRFAAFRVAAADIAGCAACLDGGHFQTIHIDDRLIVPPGQAFGVLIEFAPAAE